MFFRRRNNKVEKQIPTASRTTTTTMAVVPENDARRQMYERMARNGAVLDAEEVAQRKWRGK